MKPISTFLFCSLLSLNTPVQAQMAFDRLVMPEDVLVNNTPEATRKPGEPKLVHGVVEGAQGALPGATVWVTGSHTVAVANSEGVFELSVPDNATTVQVTCSYGGLQEEVVTLPVDEPVSKVYLWRPKAASGQRFVSEINLKTRLMARKPRPAAKN
jgi:hypothetical protein